jgi:TIR domain
MNHLIFLAHAERDRPLAKALRLALAQSLGVAVPRVFLSSDGSIPSGAKVLESVTNSLRDVRGVVVLLTPNSLRSPWVHFEAGTGAVFTRMFVVSACGITPSSLPSDLIYYSVKDLRRAPAVRGFLRNVADAVKMRFHAPRPSVIGAVTKYAAMGHEGWNLVQPALVATEVDGSPFELHKLLRDASQSAFIIGQNLWGMTCGDYASTAKSALFAFLGRRGTSVRMLIQAPGPAVEAWNSLNASSKRDLVDSTEVLQKWLGEAKQRGINSTRRVRLEIRKARLVPVSYDIVDAGLSTGLMVFRHTLHRAPRTEDRPTFAVQGGKDNPIFKHYLGCWNQAFKNAEVIRPV